MKKPSFKLPILYFGGLLFTVFILPGCTQQKTGKPGWPSLSNETKPWTRWWWHGSALTKEGITTEMEAYQKAGLGGLEITPIYGVLGYEDRFINYLSPEWMELLLHTLKEGERLGLGIDMATGTGWPFGGPWVGDDDACKDINYKIYELESGTSLTGKIEFIQQPYLRAVGNQIYEVNDNFSAERKSSPVGTRKEPLMRMDPQGIDIKQLLDPVSTNRNLQALALDQIKFEKPLALRVVMGYNDAGRIVNLTDKVDSTRKLNWVAPDGIWKIYAVFEGWHGKMVERAGPGGEGNVIDHFSSTALRHYLERFDSAFTGKDIHSLRAFFNDSYEVDDARGAAGWTPALFEEFKKRRGYNLEEHLPALFGNDAEEKNKRILCDYRETISELLLENFTQPWKSWAHGHAAIVRNQAHGSPANILDLYATVDIPEIEGVEPLRTRMASSAAHVAGKKLVSSESATWLNEHFESSLSDIKVAVDRFFLNGVNHIFYHGTSYSPPNEPWPGWLFYAAVHLNPRNSIWHDFDALNQYVARCQSLLQNSTPHNDVLLYYPVYDRFSTPGKEMIEHFDGIGKQFENTAFERAAKEMLVKGYSFDYISDKQIAGTNWEDNRLVTEGKSKYKTLVIPQANFIPLPTFKNILGLAERGATVIVFEGLPATVSGYQDAEKKKKEYARLQQKLEGGRNVISGVREIKWGEGKILVSDQLDVVLAASGIAREKLTDLGFDFIRKREDENRTLYFISNRTNEPVNHWIPLQTRGNSVVIYDPMTDEFGLGETQIKEGVLSVQVRFNPRQSLFLEVHPDEPTVRPFQHYSMKSEPIVLTAKWKIDFISGGPQLPLSVEMDSLGSWTDFGDELYKAFAGTASYQTTFKKSSESADGLLLNLGSVKESARVILNGNEIATLIGPVYETYLRQELLQDDNRLEILVTNRMANRIADLDRRKIFWRKFYNINFPARRSENRVNGLFDASHWLPKESGLLGPVTLTPITLD